MQSFYKFVKIKEKNENENYLQSSLSLSPIIAQLNSECNSVVGKFEKSGI